MGSAGAVVGHALVGEGADAAVLAEAEDLAFGRGGRGRECRRGCCARRCGEFRDGSRGREAGLEGFWIGDGELEFDLGSLHGGSIRNCGRWKTRAFTSILQLFRGGRGWRGRGRLLVGERAEDDGDAAVVELAEAGEEGLGEGFAVVEGVPAIDLDVAMVDGPVLGEHDADLFFVGEELEEAVVEFGFGCRRG